MQRTSTRGSIASVRATFQKWLRTAAEEISMPHRSMPTSYGWHPTALTLSHRSPCAEPMLSDSLVIATRLPSLILANSTRRSAGTTSKPTSGSYMKTYSALLTPPKPEGVRLHSYGAKSALCRRPRDAYGTFDAARKESSDRSTFKPQSHLNFIGSAQAVSRAGNTLNAIVPTGRTNDCSGTSRAVSTSSWRETYRLTLTSLSRLRYSHTSSRCLQRFPRCRRNCGASRRSVGMTYILSCPTRPSE